MEKLWNHIFYNKLRVAPEEHPLLLAEAPNNPRAHREKITQIMFENFNIPAFYLGPTTSLAIYGCGRTTGIVCELGDLTCHINSIYESHVIRNSMQRLDFGG